MTAHPNILWLVAEDICADLGCYGNADSITPNLDALAARGTLFSNAFSFAPVCAPARTCLATGMYPTTLGAQYMRSHVQAPDHVRLFTEYLRDTGYFCFQGFSKEDAQVGALSAEGYFTKFDYNLTKPSMEEPLPVWDAVSGYYPPGKAAHWRNRPPRQPFFGHVNFMITHSSQYGTRHLPENNCIPFTRIKDTERRDPGQIRIPSYHPDTPGSRRLWAEYHDCITEMDYQVGEILDALAADGLADDTIVFFFADNGMGVLGGKCWLWDQGIHVPLIIHCPERYRHLIPTPPGSVDERLVSFEDFAPAVLHLAGLPIPDHMQGRPFLGAGAAEQPDREYVYGMRERIDHRPETIRTVRDRRYQYIRNFMPQLGWDYSAYFWMHAPDAFEDWKKRAADNTLKGRQKVFFASGKPPEELYDLELDPEQMHNLVDSPEHAEVLHTMRSELRDWMVSTRDLGLLSEYELHHRAAGGPTMAVGADPEGYPIERLLDAAEVANFATRDARPERVDALLALLADPESAVRRWGATGLAVHFRSESAKVDPATSRALQKAIQPLTAALSDESASVRITAAEALCYAGESAAAIDTLAEALTTDSGLLLFEALWAIERIGAAAADLFPVLHELSIEPAEYWLDPSVPIEFHLPVTTDLATVRLDPNAPRRADFYRGVDLLGMGEKFFD